MELVIRNGRVRNQEGLADIGVEGGYITAILTIPGKSQSRPAPTSEVGRVLGLGNISATFTLRNVILSAKRTFYPLRKMYWKNL